MEEKILNALGALSNKLAIPVDHLWSVLVKQAIISGSINLAFAIMWVLATVGFIIFCYKTMAGEKPRFTAEDIVVPSCLLAVALVVVSGCLLIFTVPGAVIAFFNPEYWALTQITQFLK